MGGIKTWFVEKVWRKIRRTTRIVWLLTLYAVDRLIDATEEYLWLIRQELELFIGVILLAVGALSFNAARFCDGNTVDYLSCTRPAVYYYFSWFDITLVILGVFYLMFWYLKRHNQKMGE
jgi:lipoprotein signal peptidase